VLATHKRDYYKREEFTHRNENQERRIEEHRIRWEESRVVLT
jgi:hypothetical protein